MPWLLIPGDFLTTGWVNAAPTPQQEGLSSHLQETYKIPGPNTWFFPVGEEHTSGVTFSALLVYAQALETHPVQGHRDVHVLRDHPHHSATVWVLDAGLPAVGLQEAVGVLA